MWKHFKTNPKTRQVIWEHSSRIHLIISSHFCSEEGVFLLHRNWRQPHLEKKTFSSSYWQSLYQSHLKPWPRFAKLASEKISTQATLSRVTRLYLYPFFDFVLPFVFFISVFVFVSQKVNDHLKPPSPVPRDHFYLCFCLYFCLCLYHCVCQYASGLRRGRSGRKRSRLRALVPSTGTQLRRLSQKIVFNSSR